MTGDFINGSTATGILTIVYSLISISDIHYTFVLRSLSQQRVEGTIAELPSNRYGIAIFVVVETGKPFSRAAAKPNSVLINSSNFTEGFEAQHQLPIEYDLQPTSTGVCITCTFLDSSDSDCVAVVHQQISQLSSSGLMNIESSHKFTRSGDTASGCIEGVNLEDYQVGVIGGTRQLTKQTSMLLTM